VKSPVINNYSVLVAMLDGARVDDGVAFEIGYAFALGKSCIGFQTDFRRSIFGRNNPIVEAGLKSIVADEPSLLEAMRTELQRIPAG
jgi:nucleoside 2-deoxyribosyltransferase